MTDMSATNKTPNIAHPTIIPMGRMPPTAPIVLQLGLWIDLYVYLMSTKENLSFCPLLVLICRWFVQQPRFPLAIHGSHNKNSTIYFFIISGYNIWFLVHSDDTFYGKIITILSKQSLACQIINIWHAPQNNVNCRRSRHNFCCQSIKSSPITDVSRPV